MENVYTLFNTATGEILGHGTFVGPPGFSVDFTQPGGGVGWVEGRWSPVTHWIQNGDTPTLRATMTPALSKTEIVADGEDECVITGLPDPCTVTVRGAMQAGPVTVEGGELVITSTEPGEIRIRVEAKPAYLPWEGVIHAT